MGDFRLSCSFRSTVGLELASTELWEATPAKWWDSNFVRQAEFLALIGMSVVVCKLAVEESLGWMAWVAIGGAVVLLAVSRWPYGALIVLIASSVAPRFFVEIFGWKARPEHFGAALVAVVVAIWFIFRKHRVPLEKLDFWVLAYVLINYISSTLSSPEPSATLRWALQNNLAVLPYFLIRFLVQDMRTLRKGFRILLAVGLAESAYGILCFASHHVFGTTIGMESGAYFFDIAAPYGSLFEPNLFGAYTASFAVLFLSLFLGNNRHRSACMTGFIVASLATVLSLSRAALIAFVFAVIWMIRKTRRANKRWSGRVLILVPAVALGLLLIAAPIRSVLQERFANLFSQGLAEETTVTRYIVIAEALQDIPAHLLLGSGTASFQLSFDWAKYVPQWTNPSWVGNAVVRIVHDTGLVGLAMVVGFLISIWSRVRQNLHRRTPETLILLGLWAGTLLYCISFEATDGSMLAFTWVHLGFLASAAILTSESSENATAVGATVQSSI
jgi:O-antigen ligase